MVHTLIVTMCVCGDSMERTLASPRSREGGVFSGYGFHYQVGILISRYEGWSVIVENHYSIIRWKALLLSRHLRR